MNDYSRERFIHHHHNNNIAPTEEHYRSNEQKQFPGSNPEIMSMFHHMGENNGYKASLQGFPVTEIDPVGSFMSYFNEESSGLQQNQLLMVQKSSLTGDKNRMVNGFSEINNLKIPKSEPLDYEEFQVSNNFERSERSLKNSQFHDHHNLVELPNLQSYHYQKGTVPITGSDDYLVAHQPLKRFRSTTTSSESMISENGFPIRESNPNYSSSSSLESLKRSSTRLPQNIIARQKRKIISDKTSYLQKLMPWDRKMDMAAMLEEAYKYIKFLQAQVSVLQSMPCQSSFINASQMMMNGSVGAKNGFGVLGGLEKLNRRELLQVLVNSPVAQTLLYSQECCVYSLEQLILLKNNILVEQMCAAGSSSSSSTASLIN